MHTPEKDGASKPLKPKRTAAILVCSLRHVYDLGERGELEFIHDGRAAFIVADSVDGHIARMRQKAAAARTKVKQEQALRNQPRSHAPKVFPATGCMLFFGFERPVNSISSVTPRPRPILHPGGVAYPHVRPDSPQSIC